MQIAQYIEHARIKYFFQLSFHVLLEVITQDKRVILYEGKWFDPVREFFCKSCEGFADFSQDRAQVPCNDQTETGGYLSPLGWLTGLPDHGI